MYIFLVICLLKYSMVEGQKGTNETDFINPAEYFGPKTWSMIQDYNRINSKDNEFIDKKDWEDEVDSQEDDDRYIVVAPEGINKTEMELGERVYGPPSLFGLACGEGKGYYIDGYCDIKIVENETVSSNSLPCYFVCNCELNSRNVSGICVPGNRKENYDDAWDEPTTPILFDNLTSATSINLLGIEVFGFPYISGRGCGKNMVYQKLTRCDFVFEYDFSNGNRSLPCQFVCRCKEGFFETNGTCLSKYENEENYVIIPPEGTNKTKLEPDDLIYGPPNLHGVICGKYKEYRMKKLCQIHVTEKNNSFSNYPVPCYYSCNCIEGYHDNNGTCIGINKETLISTTIEDLLQDKSYNEKNLPHEGNFKPGSKNLLGEVVYGFPVLQDRGCGDNMVYQSLSSCDFKFSYDKRSGKPKLPCKYKCVCAAGFWELNSTCVNDAYLLTFRSQLGRKTFDRNLAYKSCGENMMYKTTSYCTLPFSYDRLRNSFYRCSYTCVCNKGYRGYLGICIRKLKP